VTNIAIFEVW